MKKILALPLLYSLPLNSIAAINSIPQIGKNQMKPNFTKHRIKYALIRITLFSWNSYSCGRTEILFFLFGRCEKNEKDENSTKVTQFNKNQKQLLKCKPDIFLKESGKNVLLFILQ